MKRFYVHLISFFFACFLQACDTSERLVDTAIADKTFYVTIGSDVTTLDPHLVQSTPDSSVVNSIFEGLVIADPETLESTPAVATHWTISEDGKTYRFYLRQDAVFSDGVAIDAHTFVNSFKRALSPGVAAPFISFMFFLENAEAYYNKEGPSFDEVGVKALDQYTLELTLENPLPYFITALQYPIFYPIPLHVLEKLGNAHERNYLWTKAEHIVGNGPFTFKHSRPNDSTIVEKNPLYWDAKSVKLNSIVFRSTQSALIDERMFKGGLVHKTATVPALKTHSYLSSRPKEFHHGPMYATFYLHFNVTHDVLSDVRIRKALSLSIDRQAITRSVLKGGQIVANGIVPPDDTGFKPTATSEFNPKKARELLKEAGFEGGKGFPSLTLLYNISDDREKICTAIQQMWKQHLGIDIKLMSQEWKVFLDNQDKLNYDISVRAWRGDYIHPNTFLELFMSNNDNNGTGWKSTHYDQLMRSAFAETDIDKSLAILAEAENYVIDQAPITPIYYFTRGFLLDSRVKGVYHNLTDEMVVKHIYFEGEE